MKKQHNLPLWRLERKYLEGDKLTESEIRIAADALESGILDERVVACEALLRSECGSALRDRAVAVVKELCRQTLQGELEFHPNLILTVLLIQKEIFHSDAVIREFAFAAAKDKDPSSRGNAALLMERLARHGDESARAFLVAATDDSDEAVRKNAAFFLSRLDQAGA